MIEISYELAKQLKDAGFPQFGTQFAWTDVNIGDKQFEKQIVPNHFQADFEFVAAPTLSELIEACNGKYDFTLSRFEGKKIWIAWVGYGIEREPNIESGKTPIEAVAKLWLALQKK